jgi:phosphoglycerate dehydrogenase-like enzyme
VTGPVEGAATTGTRPSRPRVVLAMEATLPSRLFDTATTRRLVEVARCDPGVVLTEFGSRPAAAALASAEILLTGWDCPPITESVLDRAPALRAIAHAAGTVKDHVTAACFERGLAVSSAAEANAIPVAEFTLAAIIFAGKAVWDAQRRYADRRGRVDLLAEYPEIGNYGRTVGIVGASRVARHLIRLLRPLELELLVYDPYLDPAGLAALGVVGAALDDLLVRSDVVTLHAPAIPETRHLLDARRLGLLRDGATLINTARGSLIDPDALAAQLTSGRISAVLDVSTPEPLPPSSALYRLPNVVLTPHLAGSAGVELRRLGRWAVDEIARYAVGLEFTSPVRLADLPRIA